MPPRFVSLPFSAPLFLIRPKQRSCFSSIILVWNFVCLIVCLFVRQSRPNGKRYYFTTALSSDKIFAESGKIPALNVIIPKLKDKRHKVLIFSSFKIMLNPVEEFAQMLDYKYCLLDGDNSFEDHKTRPNIHTFNTYPEVFLFLIKTQAGGLDLNLTTADTVIISDTD